MQVLNQSLVIEWHKFQVGSSFFVPCVDRGGMRTDIKREARRLGVNLICKPVVENGIFGVRCWRKPDIIDPLVSET